MGDDAIMDWGFADWRLQPRSSMAAGVSVAQGGAAQYTLRARHPGGPTTPLAYDPNATAEFLLVARMLGPSLGTPVSLTVSFPGLPGSDTGLISRERYLRPRDLNVTGLVLDFTAAASVAGASGQLLVFDRPLPVGHWNLSDVVRDYLRDIRLKRTGTRALGWCLSHVFGAGASVAAYSVHFSVEHVPTASGSSGRY